MRDHMNRKSGLLYSICILCASRNVVTRRKRALRLGLFCLLLLIGYLGTAESGQITGRQDSQGGFRHSARALGFVLANYDFLFYETAGGKAECPNGFTYTNRDNWEA